MAEPRATEHATHDLELITSLIGRTAGIARSGPAERLLESCPDCASLLADLALIAAATHDLPALHRSRDFRLTLDHVAPLRPSAWRRLLEVFGSSGDTLSRPVAVGLSTLGLAGLLVATVPTYFAGSAASNAAPEMRTIDGPLVPTEAAGAGGPTIAGSPRDTVVQSDIADPTPHPGSPTGPSPLLVASVVLLTSGVGLGVGRILVRRARGNHTPFGVV